ncbi:MAG TPA: hypothetical protein VH370_06695 [Humisphaera sp.]|jgi:hypothetical protein|nr:hypothetical protein [Humisphaera sp.]
MIGPKTLKAIRQELHRALLTRGRDPIRALDDLIAAPRSGTGEAAGDEVLRSLQRFVQGATHSTRQRRRSRASRTS